MYVERELKVSFGKLVPVYGVIAVVGPRQSGKTTFLKEEAKKLESGYLLFDDPDVRNMFEADIKKFELQFMQKKLSVFDEIQSCRNAGRNLKYLADSGKKIWLTSSSEAILSKQVLSFLVGRVSILRLYSFSLQEFFLAKNIRESTPLMMERLVFEHATYGGYPKVVLAEDIELKKTILKDLHETMLLKDVSQTFSIENFNALEAFAKYLALNTGNLTAYDDISKRLNLSFQTVKKYFDAMEKSYLIKRITPFYSNKTKELAKQPKTFFIDTGLKNWIAKTFNSELDGKTFENYVFTELLKAGFLPKYWRTKSKQEIDFIIEKEKELIPIEVKLNANTEKIELNLRSFIEEYHPKNAFMVSFKEKQASLKTYKNCKIHFVNTQNLIKQLKK